MSQGAEKSRLVRPGASSSFQAESKGSSDLSRLSPGKTTNSQTPFRSPASSQACARNVHRLAKPYACAAPAAALVPACPGGHACKSLCTRSEFISRSLTRTNRRFVHSADFLTVEAVNHTADLSRLSRHSLQQRSCLPVCAPAASLLGSLLGWEL